MPTKAAPKKQVSKKKPKHLKVVGSRALTVRWGNKNGDLPVIIDDGGSTRIRQVGSRLDSLIALPGSAPGTVTIGSQLKAATIRFVYLDTNGDPQSDVTVIAKKPVDIAKIDTITVATDTAVSVSVAVGATTQITLMNGVTVTPEDDKSKTHQRSYLGSDTGAMSTVSTFKNGTLVESYDTTGTVYCMLHLKFL